ncbi:MAG: RNA 2',3'-cyclic phosphodiesterase [Pseudonocardiaceae bacterium]
MRLFTALWLPDAAVAHLTAALPGRWPEGVRVVPPAQWHVTLHFHGDEAEPDACARGLADVGALAAPALRLAGSGVFGATLWVGVDGAVTALAAAAGADPDGFRPHVTVARWRGGRAPAALPADYRGPEWTAREVVLVASDLTPEGPHYTVVERAPLR